MSGAEDRSPDARPASGRSEPDSIVLEVVLGVVIVMFLLGLFDSTAST